MLNKNKKILRFDLSPDDLKVKKILGKEFVEIEVWAISDIDPNPNGSYFTLDSLKDGVKTFYRKPILGAFKYNDFSGHDGKLVKDPVLQSIYWDTENGEQILGFIPDDSNVEIVSKNGLHWIKLNAVLWVFYNYKQVKKLLKSSKTRHVSVEITIDDSYVRDDGVEVISKFTLNGITILGELITPGIPDAHLTILDMIDEELFSKKVVALQFAYKNFEGNHIEKGKGEAIMENKKIKINNSKESAIDSSSWENPGKNLYDPILESSNKISLLKEAYLVVESGYDTAPSEHLKYPHHKIKNNELVLDVKGVTSAFQRASQEGIVSGKVKAHLLRHYHELGLSTENFELSQEEKDMYSVFSDSYKSKLNNNEEGGNGKLNCEAEKDKDKTNFSESGLTDNPADVISHEPSEKFGEGTEIVNQIEEKEKEIEKNSEATVIMTVPPNEQMPVFEEGKKECETFETPEEKSEDEKDDEDEKDEENEDENEDENEEKTEDVDASIPDSHEETPNTEQVEYNLLLEKYNKLKEDYEKIIQECEKYKAENFVRECENLYAKVCSFIDEDDVLCSEEDCACKNEIKEAMKNSCMCGTFKNEEDAFECASDMMAKAVYQKAKSQKKMGKKDEPTESKKEEFSLPLSNVFGANKIALKDKDKDSFKTLEEYNNNKIEK